MTYTADEMMTVTAGGKPGSLPLLIVDGILAETADCVVSVPEIFNYWLQPGRIDVGFLGAGQLDKFGNINTTVIGADYADPVVRLPGAGGAPEIAAA
jgi:glutaconate CoA-transferase subunit B